MNDDPASDPDLGSIEARVVAAVAVIMRQLGQLIPPRSDVRHQLLGWSTRLALWSQEADPEADPEGRRLRPVP